MSDNNVVVSSKQLAHWLSEPCRHQGQRRNCIYCLTDTICDVSSALTFERFEKILSGTDETPKPMTAADVQRIFAPLPLEEAAALREYGVDDTADETNDIQWKAGLPYANGVLMTYDELASRIRPSTASIADPYKAICEGGTGGKCCDPDCEKCWPDPPSSETPVRQCDCGIYYHLDTCALFQPAQNG